MVGETLLVLQKLERFLAAILLATTTPDEADARLRKILVRDKETLGRLLNLFDERSELPEDFEITLNNLLERRNIFIHNLFMEPWFDLRTEKGCAKLRAFMSEIILAAKEAIHIMIGAFHAHEAVGPSTDETKSYINRIIQRIQETAEPNFGGLTEEEYIAKVVKNACERFSTKPRKV